MNFGSGLSKIKKFVGHTDYTQGKKLYNKSYKDLMDPFTRISKEVQEDKHLKDMVHASINMKMDRALGKKTILGDDIKKAEKFFGKKDFGTKFKSLLDQTVDELHEDLGILRDNAIDGVKNLEALAAKLKNVPGREQMVKGQKSLRNTALGSFALGASGTGLYIKNKKEEDKKEYNELTKR